MQNPWNAPQMYAASQQLKWGGDRECYWCGGACTHELTHREPPPIPFKKSDNRFIKRPSNPYICIGCWLFRRERITINFLSNINPIEGFDIAFKDIQCPLKHSWYINERGSWAIRIPEDVPIVYETLLDPPLKFVLALLEKEKINPLQVSPVNDMEELKGDSPIAFSVDGIGYTYSVYELEHVLLSKKGDGATPGTQKLYSLFGNYALKDENRPTKKLGRGRPTESPVVPVNPAQKLLKTKKEFISNRSGF